MNLFNLGEFTLHSGADSTLKIDCDVLTDGDLEAVAAALARLVPPFGRVEGVPSGGLRLAEAMGKWAGGSPDRLLIVDDVLTTGRSMEEHRAGRPAYGAVIFSRGEPPSWVVPFLRLTRWS